MSRRRRTGIIVLCMLTIGALAWLDYSHIRGKLQSQPKSEEQAKTNDFQKYHNKTFTVVNVVDGDTIDIDIPDGNNSSTRIRLWGIDTPETKNPNVGVMYFGPEAAEFATKLVLGKPVAVYLDEGNNTRGKYGRLLAYVKLPNDGFLNEVLLTEGYAYADVRFRHSLYNKYGQLESSARSLKKGLWEKVNREQLPEWLQREKPNLRLNK
jgi:micrococcal nuclease